MNQINDINIKIKKVINLFSKNNIDKELKKLPNKLVDSLDDIIKTQSFISGSDIITVFTEIYYDPDDTIFALSREDRSAGFWTQYRKELYLNFLDGKNKKFNKLNQIRLRIYNDSEQNELMKESDIYFRLKELHNNNTYFSLKASELSKFHYINDLIFGALISNKYKYAIIPIPSHISLGIQSIGVEKIDLIGQILALYGNYDMKHGPLKAIITINTDYVNNLLIDFKNALSNKNILTLK